jgi:hypothetical protein
MALEHEFLVALRGGAGHDHLLELVQRHQAGGVKPRAAYDILERIWLEFGFNDSDEQSALRDDLEYVMEKMWYACPTGER